jgi:hypothetical protein
VQPWEPVLRLCALFLAGLCDTLVQYVACWTIVLLVLWINDVGEYNSIPITLLRTTLHFFSLRYVGTSSCSSSRMLLIDRHKLALRSPDLRILLGTSVYLHRLIDVKFIIETIQSQ